MAGPIRNSCVARGEIPDGVGTTIYTVPPDNSFLLKSLLLYPATKKAGNYDIFLLAPSVGVALAVGALQANTILSWSGWVALNAGDSVWIGFTGDITHFWLSGALLPFIGAGAPATRDGPPFVPPPFQGQPAGPGIDTGIARPPA